MAILHVAAGGSNTAPYETWAKAASSVVVAAAAAAGGDTIWFDSTYTDSASGQTINFASGNQANPVRLISGTQSGASGISALAAGGTVVSTSTTLAVTGTAFIYGMTIQGSSASATSALFGSNANSMLTLDTCTLYLSSTNVSSRINLGYDTAGTNFPLITLKNVTFRFGSVNQSVGLNSNVVILGGIQHASSSDVTTFFSAGNLNRGCNATITGFDFSNCTASVNLITQTGTTCFVRLRNCKLPTSWSGTLLTAPTAGGNRFEMLNYSINGVTGSNNRFQTTDSTGVCTESTSIYRTGGASDEATPYSVKMVSASSCSWPGHYLRSPPMVVRVPVPSGTTNAISVEITFDDATAHTDKDVWLEVEFLGTTDYPVSTFANDTTALLTGLTGAGTTQTSSGSSWTGTGGFTNGKTQTLSVTGLNTQLSGYAIATVCLGLASKTIYVDPKVTVIEE